MVAIQSNSATSLATSPTIDDPTTEDYDGGDIGIEVAALAVKTGDAERTTSHEQRDLDETAEETADDKQVSEMHSEASSMRAGAVFDATVGVVSEVALAVVPGADAKFVTVAQEAASKTGDALFKAGQQNDETSVVQAKAAADRAANDAKDDTDAATDANANISAALDFARSYISLEGQTQSAALHRT